MLKLLLDRAVVIRPFRNGEPNVESLSSVRNFAFLPPFVLQGPHSVSNLFPCLPGCRTVDFKRRHQNEFGLF